MLKAYKYRIYPNNEQKVQIAKTFGCCRFVYNQTLVYRKEKYEKEKKSAGKTDCNNYCNRELKQKYEWLREADKFALTNAIYNMDTAYQKFLGNKQVIQLQRQLAHKEKRSNNYYKTRKQIGLCHEIISENQVIVPENLQIKNMVKNHHLAKSISDVSWYELTRQLEYNLNP